MKYKYKPKTKEELVEAIKKEIYEVQGTPNNPNWQADLNCIDTSEITDMSELFSNEYGVNRFNGNISNWNVSNVKDMEGMFRDSYFNNDISKWNVSNVRNMFDMFSGSIFNQNISDWDVSNVTNMGWMFSESKFNKEISDWDVSNVKNMTGMFYESKFNQPIGNWNVSNVKTMGNMFQSSEFNQDISNWNVSNVKDMDWMFANNKFNQDISNWKINENANVFNMLFNSKLNKDIGNWPKKIKEQIGLKNISISSKYPKLPDEIRYPKTIANIFNFIIEHQNSKEITKQQAVNILTQWLNDKQKEYINKNIDKKTVKQLLTNYFLDILKNINNKEKFLEILKKNKIDIDLEKEM